MRLDDPIYGLRTVIGSDMENFAVPSNFDG